MTVLSGGKYNAKTAGEGGSKKNHLSLWEFRQARGRAINAVTQKLMIKESRL